MMIARGLLATLLLSLTLTAHAEGECTPGKVLACTVQGQSGVKACVAPGRWLQCQTKPITGTPATVFGKYLILTVIYAPPGTNGGKSQSNVSYEQDSSTGTTTTNSSSFKQDYKVSATVTCNDCDYGVFGTTASFEYSKNATHADALDIKKTTGSKIQVAGPPTDGVDHGSDMVWMLIHPKFALNILSNKSVQWSLDPDQTGGSVQYLYVAQLRDPNRIPPQLAHDLQAAGFTAQDYQTLLNADPLAACAPLSASPGHPGVAAMVTHVGVGLPCNTPAPKAPRYVATNQNLPYDPPLTANASVPLQTITLDNSVVLTNTNSTTNTYETSVTLSGGLTIEDAVKLVMTNTATFTWTDLNTTAAMTGNEQKSALTLGGPAYGYSGQPNIDVYYDTLYKTFVFLPSDVQTNSTFGLVTGKDGKPVAGQLVTAHVGKATYRTYTNAQGKYHFSRKFTGPVTIQTGAVTRKLKQPPPIGTAFELKE